MPATVYQSGKSGETTLSGGNKFRWNIQGERPPEVYGWIEKDHSIVKGSGGFWRTPDPVEATKRAAAAFGLEVEP